MCIYAAVYYFVNVDIDQSFKENWKFELELVFKIYLEKTKGISFHSPSFLHFWPSSIFFLPEPARSFSPFPLPRFLPGPAQFG